MMRLMAKRVELSGTFHKSVGGYLYLFQGTNGRWYFADRLMAVAAFTVMEGRGIKPNRVNEPPALLLAYKKHGATATAYYSFPEYRT